MKSNEFYDKLSALIDEQVQRETECRALIQKIELGVLGDGVYKLYSDDTEVITDVNTYKVALYQEVKRCVRRENMLEKLAIEEYEELMNYKGEVL